MSTNETVRASDRSLNELTQASNLDVARRFVHSFDEAVADTSEANIAALHAATIALAASLCGAELPPERAVIVLKSLLRGHGPPGWSPSLATQRHAFARAPESLVYAKLFGWWVVAYYADCGPLDT